MDISALADATGLRWINLNNNLITDLSPLVANSGMGPGDTASFGADPLDCPNQLANIALLQARGVLVRHGCD